MLGTRARHVFCTLWNLWSVRQHMGWETCELQACMTGRKPRDKLLCIKMNTTHHGLIASNRILSWQMRGDPSSYAHEELVGFHWNWRAVHTLCPVLNLSKQLSKLSAGLNTMVSYEFDCHSTMSPMQWWDHVLYFNSKFSKQKTCFGSSCQKATCPRPIFCVATECILFFWASLSLTSCLLLF